MANLDVANIRINRKDYPRILGLLPRSAAAHGYDGNDHIVIHDCPYALAKRFILRIGFEVECGTEWRKIQIANVKMLDDAYSYIAPSKYPYNRSMITLITYIDEDTNEEFYQDRIEVTHVIDSEETELSVKFHVISDTEFAIKLKENNFDYKYIRFESTYDKHDDAKWIRVANVYCKKISQEPVVSSVEEQNRVEEENDISETSVESVMEDNAIKEEPQEEKAEKAQNSYHRNNNQKYDKNKKYERR